MPCLLLLIATVCPAVGLPADTVVVSVSDSTSGRPVEGVTITLSPPDGDPQEAVTDLSGKAAFPGMRNGDGRIRAEKPSYIDLLDPAGHGRSMAIFTSQPILIELTRCAVVSGTVVDSQGEPLEHSKVMLLARRRFSGSISVAAVGEAAYSDDRGHYRIAGVAPGWYAVAAMPVGEPDSAVFAPVQSEFLLLAAGEERREVNLMVRLWSAGGATISGVLSGMPSGQTAAVALASTTGPTSILAGVLSSDNGSFAFPDVPPGEYRLLAWTPPGGRDDAGDSFAVTARAANRSLSATGADLRADLVLRPLAKLDGRLVGEGAGCNGAYTPTLQLLDGWLPEWTPAVTVKGNRLEALAVPPGRLRIDVADLGDSCTLEAVRVGDRAGKDGVIAVGDATSVTVLLRSANGEISGTAIGDGGKPAIGIVVLARSDGTSSLRIAPIDAKGRYVFHPVASGEYLIVARERLDSTDFWDAVEHVRSGATAVTVEPGKQQKCDLQLLRK
jgi:hypothetical protein